MKNTLKQINRSRYIIRDARESQHSALVGKIREPWQVIDVETNRIVDELHSKRTAQMIVAAMNRGQR
jgi:hypothetical protein